jgi:hypothetical protein
MRATCLVHLIIHVFIERVPICSDSYTCIRIFSEGCKRRSYLMKFSPTSCYVIQTSQRPVFRLYPSLDARDQDSHRCVALNIGHIHVSHIFMNICGATDFLAFEYTGYIHTSTHYTPIRPICCCLHDGG